MNVKTAWNPGRGDREPVLYQNGNGFVALAYPRKWPVGPPSTRSEVSISLDCTRYQLRAIPSTRSPTMARKKQTTLNNKAASNAVASRSGSTPTSSPTIRFPTVSQKHDLECRELLEDQILLIDEFFSPEECKTFVKFIDSLPLELTPPKKRGEAERVNHRISITSLDFAQALWAVLAPHLPEFPYPSSVKRPAGSNPRRAPNTLNTNIRMYKYTPGQHFGPHYDDSVRDPLTGANSEWTLLVYLSGAEDGVTGGETIFYKDERGKPRESIVALLTRGTALLHRHGNECLLHEGSEVRSGTKYILRSDLMFMN